MAKGEFLFIFVWIQEENTAKKIEKIWRIKEKLCHNVILKWQRKRLAKKLESDGMFK